MGTLLEKRQGRGIISRLLKVEDISLGGEHIVVSGQRIGYGILPSADYGEILPESQDMIQPIITDPGDLSGIKQQVSSGYSESGWSRICWPLPS